MTLLRKCLSIFLSGIFILTGVAPARGSEFLPAAGQMVHFSGAFTAPELVGVRVYSDQPFRFDFILDKGDTPDDGHDWQDESQRLIKYFLASLTIPEKDLWVNLSPEEKDRIVPEAFGLTEMGRDLLQQDYLLKQIAASALNPDEALGREFWDEVYRQAQAKFGTTDIPVDTRHRVWIVPSEVTVNEKPDAAKGSAAALVVGARLKVMLEVDYLALSRKTVAETGGDPANVDGLANQVMRDIVIPALEKEVNEGEHFSRLRQVYHSFILAAWYKKKLKDSIAASIYVDKNKIAGVDTGEPDAPQRVYEQYLESFRKGVFNFIKEEKDGYSGDVLPRKYFSGGIVLSDSSMRVLQVEDILNGGKFIPDRCVVVSSLARPAGWAGPPGNFVEAIKPENVLDIEANIRRITATRPRVTHSFMMRVKEKEMLFEARYSRLSEEESRTRIGDVFVLTVVAKGQVHFEGEVTEVDPEVLSLEYEKPMPGDIITDLTIKRAYFKRLGLQGGLFKTFMGQLQPKAGRVVYSRVEEPETLNLLRQTGPESGWGGLANSQLRQTLFGRTFISGMALSWLPTNGSIIGYNLDLLDQVVPGLGRRLGSLLEQASQVERAYGLRGAQDKDENERERLRGQYGFDAIETVIAEIGRANGIISRISAFYVKGRRRDLGDHYGQVADILSRQMLRLGELSGEAQKAEAADLLLADPSQSIQEPSGPQGVTFQDYQKEKEEASAGSAGFRQKRVERLILLSKRINFNSLTPKDAGKAVSGFEVYIRSLAYRETTPALGSRFARGYFTAVRTALARGKKVLEARIMVTGGTVRLVRLPVFSPYAAQRTLSLMYFTGHGRSRETAVQEQLVAYGIDEKLDGFPPDLAFDLLPEFRGDARKFSARELYEVYRAAVVKASGVREVRVPVVQIFATAVGGDPVRTLRFYLGVGLDIFEGWRARSLEVPAPVSWDTSPATVPMASYLDWLSYKYAAGAFDGDAGLKALAVLAEPLRKVPFFSLSLRRAGDRAMTVNSLEKLVFEDKKGRTYRLQEDPGREGMEFRSFVIKPVGSDGVSGGSAGSIHRLKWLDHGFGLRPGEFGIQINRVDINADLQGEGILGGFLKALPPEVRFVKVTDIVNPLFAVELFSRIIGDIRVKNFCDTSRPGSPEGMAAQDLQRWIDEFPLFRSSMDLVMDGKPLTNIANRELQKMRDFVVLYKQISRKHKGLPRLEEFVATTPPFGSAVMQAGFREHILKASKGRFDAQLSLLSWRPAESVDPAASVSVEKKENGVVDITMASGEKFSMRPIDGEEQIEKMVSEWLAINKDFGSLNIEFWRIKAHAPGAFLVEVRSGGSLVGLSLSHLWGGLPSRRGYVEERYVLSLLEVVPDLRGKRLGEILFLKTLEEAVSRSAVMGINADVAANPVSHRSGKILYKMGFRSVPSWTIFRGEEIPEDGVKPGDEELLEEWWGVSLKDAEGALQRLYPLKDSADNPTRYLQLDLPGFGPEAESIRVDAPLDEAEKGGIDLGAGTMDMKVQGQAGGFYFNISPEELKVYQDAPGLTPVIYSIKPLESFPRFFGAGVN